MDSALIPPALCSNVYHYRFIHRSSQASLRGRKRSLSRKSMEDPRNSERPRFGPAIPPARKVWYLPPVPPRRGLHEVVQICLRALHGVPRAEENDCLLHCMESSTGLRAGWAGNYFTKSGDDETD